MLKELGDKGKTILLNFLHNILKTGNMPKDFLKSEFAVIPKKPEATKCSDYRIITDCRTGLMSHGIRLLLNRLAAISDFVCVRSIPQLTYHILSLWQEVCRFL